MSLFTVVMIVLGSQVFLWAGRAQIHRALRAAGTTVSGALRLAARWIAGLMERVRSQQREALLEAGREQSEARVSRELRRLDGRLQQDLSKHAALRRKLDDVITQLDEDYQQCGQAPPEAPGWGAAVKAVQSVDQLGDKGSQKILAELKIAAVEGEKRALSEYRKATSQRHKILSRMSPAWKELKKVSQSTTFLLGDVLHATNKVDATIEKLQNVQAGTPAAVSSLRRAAVNLFIISAAVMAVAVAGGFINFNLIALPMSELVPAGTRISGVPVSTIAALVIVLMEVTAGIFLMEAIGITHLFPQLQSLPPSRKRLIMGIAFTGIFLLSCTEASLAILREQIVGAETALMQTLAGGSDTTVVAPVSSNIPMIGQAVLGFILPWVLALIAIPLETLIGTGSVVVGAGVVGVLGLTGVLLRVTAHLVRYLATVIRHTIDFYIVVPIRLEQLVRYHWLEEDPDAEKEPHGGDPVIADTHWKESALSTGESQVQ